MVKRTDKYPTSISRSMRTVPMPPADIPLAISVVSNCRLLREGLAVMLRERLTLATIEHYLAATPQTPTLPNPKEHVVLVDSNIGPDPCLDWIRYWRSRAALVIMIELGWDIEFLIACIEAGVGAYTVENASIDDIIQAIDQVRRGAATCSPELAGKLFARLASYAANHAQFQIKPNSPLTVRETEVLRCAAKGYSNQEIAETLVISLTTVKHHIHNILEKLELSHRWDAIRYAEERGWLVANG